MRIMGIQNSANVPNTVSPVISPLLQRMKKKKKRRNCAGENKHSPEASFALHLASDSVPSL
jgi:hypothetical protein